MCIRDSLALSRDCLVDLGRAINFLLQKATEHNLDSKKLKSFLLDISTLQRQCEAQSNDLTFLLDATLGLVGARQSRALNFMAVVTLLFAPATLISSIFGMNSVSYTHLDVYKRQGLDKANDENTMVFHAGTKLNEGNILRANGGRVLNVTSCGPDLQKTLDYACLLYTSRCV